MPDLRLGFINAFKSMGLGKGADILFSKPEIFLRTEVEIITAIKEEKKGSFTCFVYLYWKVQYP